MSGAQRRAQTVRLGVLILELEKTLQNQNCSEKELRALEHQILHLATILKVPLCTYTHIHTAPGYHPEGTCVYFYTPVGDVYLSECVDPQNDLSLLRSSSSEETLAVEEVLGSFDFLSHDFNADDDASCLGSLRIKDSG